MITQAELQRLLTYEPETGLFRWRVSRPPRGRVGAVAGYDNGAGYIKLSIGGARYFAHRMAFLWMTGSIPAEIDHINQRGGDNRWENLRASDRRQNTANVSGKVNYPRVGVRKRFGSWYARYGSEHLGVFSSREAALAARKAREIELCGHDPNRTKATV